MRTTDVPLMITVYGTPAPQGSKRHLGRGVMVESSAKVKPWREAVKHAALDALDLTGPLFTRGDSLHVQACFYFARPRSHYRTGRNSDHLRPDAPEYVTGRPDLDKLLRSTFDALGEAGVYHDDAQVVRVEAVKFYADACPPGAVLRVLRHPTKETP